MKSIAITPKVIERLKANLGGETPDLNDLVVFEAMVLSSRPLSQRGSLFNKATNSRSTLVEMAEILNKGGHVPLHTLHKSGSELPIGRFFHAGVSDMADGHTELSAMFYINKKDHPELVSSIESGVIEAVSVGLVHRSLLCSECGWDYKGEDASFFNFWDQTCANDHVIGENGVHLNCVGAENWFETSLVSRGADKTASIVNRAKARLSEEERGRLAASGVPFEAFALVATQKQKDTNDMSIAELTTRLETLAGEKAVLTAQMAEANTALTAANARIAELEAAVAATPADNADELTAAQTQVTELTASLDAANTEKDAALTFLKEQAVKALIASGQSDPKAPDTVAECIAAIGESKMNLVNLLANAGNSIPADAGADKRQSVAVNAFKTRK